VSADSASLPTVPTLPTVPVVVGLWQETLINEGKGDDN